MHHRKKTRRKPLADVVRNLARTGLVEDQIAARVGLDKNELRARFIDQIKAGRKALAAASARQLVAMTRHERHAANLILNAFSDGEWIVDGRSLLWSGLDGDATSAPDAFAKWLSDGARLFICTGTSQFSRERLREFAALKRAAQQLLTRR